MSLNHCIYNTPSQLTWSVKKRFTDSHLHSHPLSPMLSETLQFTFWHWSWDLNSSTSWKALWIAHMTACHINSQKQPSGICKMVSIFFHSWVSTSQTVIHNRIVTISWIPLSTFWLAALISLFPLCLAPNLVLPHLLHPLLLPCFQSCRKPEHKIAQLFVIDERLIDTGHTVTLLFVRAITPPMGLQATSPTPPVSPLSRQGTLAITAPMSTTISANILRTHHFNWSNRYDKKWCYLEVSIDRVSHPPLQLQAWEAEGPTQHPWCALFAPSKRQA